MIHILWKWDLQKEWKLTSHLQQWCRKCQRYLRFLLDSSARSWTSLWYHQMLHNWHQYYAEYLDVKNLPSEHKEFEKVLQDCRQHYSMFKSWENFQGPNHPEKLKPTCRIAWKKWQKKKNWILHVMIMWMGQFDKLYVLFIYFCTNIYLVIVPKNPLFMFLV